VSESLNDLGRVGHLTAIRITLRAASPSVSASIGPVSPAKPVAGVSAGQLLALARPLVGAPREADPGIAAAQLAGEDFLPGLDRQRADAAGQLQLSQ
jgi:hypothetical protein